LSCPVLRVSSRSVQFKTWEYCAAERLSIVRGGEALKFAIGSDVPKTVRRRHPKTNDGNGVPTAVEKRRNNSRTRPESATRISTKRKTENQTKTIYCRKLVVTGDDTTHVFCGLTILGFTGSRAVWLLAISEPQNS